MPQYIDPRRFVGKPMLLKTVADGDSSVMIDGKRAGRILHQVRSGQRQIWFWTMTGPFVVSAGLESSGEVESLEEAKAAIRTAFDVWLKWALEEEKPVVWHG
ncbi:hypothetical protein [Aestuariivirga sp.]|uniref:hypothetical protein n=1 Tax=Aestuariivirga sp. TaxID=2650926 RepID=UPI00359412C5